MGQFCFRLILYQTFINFSAHPNIKVFIAHGGLIGTQEAVYNGVPILGIPIYADQYNNLLQTEHHGFGKILEFKDINEENLKKVLNEVLTNESYKRNAEQVSKRFRDRPMTPLDTAMFWIEYVIRNKDAAYMQNPALALSWVASNMLDVYAFVLILVLAIIFIFAKLLAILVNIFTNQSYVVKITKENRYKKKTKWNYIYKNITQNTFKQFSQTMFLIISSFLL